MLTDLRLALRTLRARPGLVLAVVLCLALGIGVNSTVYSMVSAVLLRPLPFDAPDRLVAIRQLDLASGGADDWLPLADFADLRAESRALESAGAIAIRDVSFGVGTGGAIGLRAAAVTPGWFETLGIRPTLGRTIRDAADATASVVVLGDRVWREQLDADPAVVGRVVRVNGVAHEVIGVMPPDAVLTNDIEQLWIPADPAAPDLSRLASAYRMVGRLKPGATVGAVDAEVRATAARLAREHPATNAGRGAMALPYRETLPAMIRTLMAVMLGAVTLVLLVACANVANLMLGHGVARAHEMAVRTALGAGRWRIARLLLLESVLLGVAGAAAGLLLASWGLRATLASFPFQFPAWLQPTVDVRVLAYTMLVGVASGVVFGLLPALRAGAVPPGAVLKDGGRGASGGRARSRLRDALVAAQLSLSLVLLVSAALMMKSFVVLQGVEPGWTARGVLATRVSLTDERFASPDARLAALAAVRTRLADLPGVASVAAAPQPPTSTGAMTLPADVEGRDAPRPEDRPMVDVRPVVGDYLAALQVPLVAGRAPTAAESLDPEARVAVVSQGTADRLWPAGDAIGRRITIRDTAYTVVGVAADARQRGLAREPGNTLYVPYATRPLARSVTFLVRTDGEPRALAAATRAAVAAVDPALAILDVETLPVLLDESLWHERLFGRMFTAFGVAALVLATVGLYGVVSHATRQRTHEIGVRVALGARAADVRRLVLAGSLRVVLASVVVGVVLAAALVRLLASMLYGVSTTDPLVYAGVTLALAAVALVAAWIPARRAARVDPVIALRTD